MFTSGDIKCLSGKLEDSPIVPDGKSELMIECCLPKYKHEPALVFCITSSIHAALLPVNLCVSVGTEFECCAGMADIRER